ncbi:hypothetical protein LPJ63_004336 [Coemansia sp. RSA 2711]|nr:hypothetical protein LPJ63_004336 [Coemansia sp. RSA 2711]
MAAGKLVWTAVVGMAALAQQAHGALSSSGTITYHDYQSLPLSALAYNPPACGMPYAELDLTRITAVQAIDTTSECGQCLKVSNANDPSKYVYVLAVDKGGRGLDLSKPAFGRLFNIDDGVGPAQWSPVDNSNCKGVWSNGGDSAYNGAQVPASSAEPATTSAPAVNVPATTPVASPVPVAPAPAPVSSAPLPASTQPAVVPPSAAVQRSSSIQLLSQPQSSSSEHPALSSSSELPPADGREPSASASDSQDDSSSDSDYAAVGIAHEAQDSSRAVSSDLDELSSSSETDGEELLDSDTSGAASVSLAISALAVVAMLF